MKLINGQGNAVGARQVWHYAFETGVNSIDMREVLNSFGVQFTSKGSDNCVMQHCDKGKIQQVISKIRVENRFAWAWGMSAYAPEGAENRSLLNSILLPFAFDAVRTEKFNPDQLVECGHLAYTAIYDAGVEARTGKRNPRRRNEMAAMLRCDAKTYLYKWAKVFFAMKDAIKDLDAIALPPVANLIWTLIDKDSIDPDERADAIEDLEKLLKQKVEAA